VTLRGAKRSRRRIAGLATLGVLGIAIAAPGADAQSAVTDLHTAAAMGATVHELRRCVSSIPAPDRLLLSLRFGIGGRPQKTDAAVAARLQTTSAIVATREVLAVRRLNHAHRRGACNSGHVTASAASSAAAALSPVAAAGGARRPGGGGTSSDELLAGAVLLAALFVVGREFRKAMSVRPPRH
jgi:hypothetical protein